MRIAPPRDVGFFPNLPTRRFGGIGNNKVGGRGSTAPASQTMSASEASEPVPADPLRVLRSVCSALEKPPGAFSTQTLPTAFTVCTFDWFCTLCGSQP